MCLANISIDDEKKDKEEERGHREKFGKSRNEIGNNNKTITSFKLNATSIKFSYWLKGEEICKFMEPDKKTNTMEQALGGKEQDKNGKWKMLDFIGNQSFEAQLESFGFDSISCFVLRPTFFDTHCLFCWNGIEEYIAGAMSI